MHKSRNRLTVQNSSLNLESEECVFERYGLFLYFAALAIEKLYM